MRYVCPPHGGAAADAVCPERRASRGRVIRVSRCGTSSPAPPASSARTSRRRSRDRGPRGRRHRLLHRLLRRRAEGGERARARRSGGSTSRATRSTSTGSTASSISPGSRACGASATSSRLYVERNVLASQRLFEAAARDGVRVVFASSSSIYGEAERVPDRRRTSSPGPVSPVRHHEAHLRAPRPRERAELRPRRGRAALLQRLRPAAAAGHGVHADRDVPRRGSPVRPLRRRPPVAQLHVRRRRRRGDDRGDGARQRHLQRRRRRGGDDARRRSRSSRSSPAAASRSASTRPCPATSGGRRPTRR